MTHKQTYLKLYSSLKDRLERLSADNPIELALLVFFAALLLVVSLSIPYYSASFYENVLVESHGMLLDLLIIGVFVYWLDSLGDKKREMRRYQEEIDDYLNWQSHEATYRIIGNVRRLNRENVTEIHLENAYLPQANLITVILDGANLQGASLPEANLQQARLVNADLRGACLQGANLSKANLRGAKLQGASHWESSALELFLNEAKAHLKVTDLQGANLREAVLANANLRGTNLQGVDLWNADLEGANLHRANLRGASLWEADLRASELQSANLQRANLRSANLRAANLKEADLQSARLQRADLQSAELSGAKLQKARLQEANLQHANLQRAYLHGANLRNAILDEAQLAGVRYNRETRWPDTFDPDQAGAIFDDDSSLDPINGPTSNSTLATNGKTAI